MLQRKLRKRTSNELLQCRRCGDRLISGLFFVFDAPSRERTENQKKVILWGPKSTRLLVQIAQTGRIMREQRALSWQHLRAAVSRNATHPFCRAVSSSGKAFAGGYICHAESFQFPTSEDTPNSSAALLEGGLCSLLCDSVCLLNVLLALHLHFRISQCRFEYKVLSSKAGSHVWARMRGSASGAYGKQ